MEEYPRAPVRRGESMIGFIETSKEFAGRVVYGTFIPPECYGNLYDVGRTQGEWTTDKLKLSTFRHVQPAGRGMAAKRA